MQRRKDELVVAVERVLIVGGGIAGLATAAGLTRAGVECVVVESATAWRPIGAGIILNANAMAALHMLGLAEGVASRGLRLGEGAITDQRGRDMARTNFRALDAEFGPTISVHRAELHAALLEGASTAKIFLGTSVERIDQQPNGVKALLTDGREEYFDLVIGADGLHSRVREMTFGCIPPVYAGYTCWRFVTKATLPQSRMCEMWGRGKRFGVVPLSQEQFYVFAVANAAPGATDHEQKNLKKIRCLFGDFGGPAPALLEALEAPNEVICNDLYSVPVGNWFEGHVVLIGDAAHAMTPNMGQGAGMGLEDAAVLVDELLQQCPVSDALSNYRLRREDRVTWVHNQSRRIGEIAQVENAMACQARNAIIKVIPNCASNRALRKLVSQPI